MDLQPLAVIAGVTSRRDTAQGPRPPAAEAAEALAASESRRPAVANTSAGPVAPQQRDLEPAAASADTNLDFLSDEQTGQPVMRIVEKDTGEVVRQFPSEAALAIASLIDRQRELMLRQKR